ncbi:MAG: capsular biosynthesis protein, partial [Bacteroidales bacterium]|nr:capsular biosynthesis protein [Bacteroidales bacterium]
HSHILFGVDDGVASLEESLNCLSFYEQQGLSDLWLTPHVMEEIPNQTEALRARFEELVQAYEAVPGERKIKLHLAAEYMLDTVFEQRLSQNDLLSMDGRFLLVETSTWEPPINLWGILERIKSAGYRPIFAHTERYRYLQPSDYDRLHNMGVFMQLNIGSIFGGYGEGSMRRAQIILDKGYYCCSGSDCHKYEKLVNQCSVKALDKKLQAKIKELITNKL